MITAIEPTDVLEVLQEHEKTHPEYQEWQSFVGRRFDLSDFRDSLHDHDCIFVICACKCGCKAEFCVASLKPEDREKPMLCDMCELYQGRGHVGHHL
jgi:hypothetical protein